MKITNWRPSTETAGGHWIVTRDTLRKATTDRGREMSHGYVQKHKRGDEVVRFPSYKEALAKADELNNRPDTPLCSCGVPGCQGISVSSVTAAPPPPRRRTRAPLYPVFTFPEETSLPWDIDSANDNEN